MKLVRRLWYLFNRGRRERELLDEMREHRAAMHDPSKFGDTHRMVERSRDEWGWNWLDDAVQDFSVGARTLWRSPLFAITGMLILTFGIGLNVTLYQMLQATLLQPPAIKSAESWARFHRAMKNGSSTAVPYPVTKFVEANNSVLAAVVVKAGSSMAWGRDLDGTVNAAFVSTNWFTELGYGALHGRALSDALDTRADRPSVVIGYTFWRNRLGADPNIVGATVYFDRQPALVAGVAPRELPGFELDAPDVFIPITQREYFYPDSPFLQAWNTDSVEMYGRFKDGVQLAAVREALRGVMAALAAERREVEPGMWLEPLPAAQNFMRAQTRREILIMVSMIAALTSLVLIVAAANLGNLVMSRTAGRVRELGVRMALGAGRGRIVRQLVVEGMPLAFLGAIGSLAFASAATSLAGLPAYLDFSVDWRTLGVALGLAGVALAVIGLLPAWKVAQHHLIDAIKDGGQQVSQTLDRAMVRRVMIGAQVAGACVLLIVAGMMVRSVQRVVGTHPGFDYERAAVLSVPLDRYGMAGETARAYWYAVKERALANPEVEQAAVVTAPPLGGRVYQTMYDGMPQLAVYSQSVDPEFFDTMKIPLLAGRLFQAGEADTTIVSRRLALEMYGTMDVLGLGFPKHDPKTTITGVAADAHAIKVNATNAAEVYTPLRVDDFSEVFLVARARADVTRLPAILREAAAFDPRVIPTTSLLAEDFDRNMSGPRIAGAIASGIGALTLLLVCIGIFGVVSHGVALRTKEIGIRVALGARPPRLLASIVRQILTPVGVGIAAGVAAAIPIGRALSGDPFYLQLGDPIAFAVALSIFAMAAVTAALWPAARVLRANPVDALRHQ